jgi:hypothetical protein
MAIRQALERLVGIENKPRRDSEPACRGKQKPDDL